MPIKKITNYDIYFGGYVHKNKRVKKVSLNETSLILYAGDTCDLSFSVNPADGFYDEIEWTSSDPNVVSVDEDGHIVALKAGRAIITIKINNATSKCIVNVREVIHFEDPLVKSILVRNYDTDGDGEISYTEAYRITSIPFPMFTGTPIKTFNELAYFKNLKTIAPHAFDSCENLTYISFPPGLEKINKNAFSYCNSLKEITITPNVQSIGSEAFSDCANLTTAYINSNIPPKNGNKILDRCPNLERIIVPGEYVEDYLKAINWGMLTEDEYLYYSYIIIQCFDYTFDFFLS